MNKTKGSKVAGCATFLLVALLGLPGCAPTLAAEGSTPEAGELDASSAADGAWSDVVSVYPDALRPDVEPVRTVSTDEWADVISQCLRDEGFPAVTSPGDGSIEWSGVPQAQMQSFHVARYSCTVMFPRDPSHQGRLTPAQLDKLYDYYVGELTDCLQNLKYEVPPRPSREVFKETYYTAPWLPFAEAFSGPLSEDQRSQLSRDCPQAPSDL